MMHHYQQFHNCGHWFQSQLAVPLKLVSQCNCTPCTTFAMPLQAIIKQHSTVASSSFVLQCYSFYKLNSSLVLFRTFSLHFSPSLDTSFRPNHNSSRPPIPLANFHMLRLTSKQILSGSGTKNLAHVPLKAVMDVTPLIRSLQLKS